MSLLVVPKDAMLDVLERVVDAPYIIEEGLHCIADYIFFQLGEQLKVLNLLILAFIYLAKEVVDVHALVNVQ